MGANRSSAGNRRLGLISSTLLLASACSPSETAQMAGGPRPDVIVYMVDTLRADELGTYGAQVTRTPNLDAFAAEGTLFENAYALSANTRASVASFLTGVEPIAHGAENTFVPLSRTAALARLPEVLRRAGYATAAVIANPNAATVFGFDVGFERFDELYAGPIEVGPVLMDKLEADAGVVLQAVRRVLDGAGEKPLFLFVLSIDPHSPYAPPDEYETLYDPEADGELHGSLRAVLAFDRKLERGKNPSPDRLLALYRGEVTYADHVFGQLLDELATRDRLERTFVAFTSDHGEEFADHGQRGHGKALYEEVTRVPLIVRHPAAFDSALPAGVRRAERVDLTDLAATIAAVAGVPRPAHWLGRDLRAPLATRPILSSLRKPDLDLVAVRTERWKGIFDRRTGSAEFFDLVDDPREERPLQGAARRAARAQVRPLFDQLIASSFARRAELVGDVEASEDLPPKLREALEALGYAR